MSRQSRVCQFGTSVQVFVLMLGAVAAWSISDQFSEHSDQAVAQDNSPSGRAPGGFGNEGPRPNVPERKVGVEVNDPRALQGYTLISPMNSTKTYLIDMEGRVVHTWECGCTPALGAYLLENGHLLRPGSLPPDEQRGFGPGMGGRIQEYTWDGELVWEYRYVNERRQPHHDITRLPNGNVLMVVSEKYTKEEAIAAGRRPAGLGDMLQADCIVEVKPTGKTSGEIVWEWRVWDHLVQDFDKEKANYGRVAAHPELIDVNFGDRTFGQMMARPEDAERLRALGYVGGAPPAPLGTPPAGGPPQADNRGPGNRGPGGPGGPPGMGGDWTHINSVAYNAELDQIMLSVHGFSEIWIIDHGTTTAEAKGHSGGKRGKGGDLLYRWGNPRAYRSGTNADQRLFGQHNAHWIPQGLPGAGHMLVFNNGMGRPDGAYSTVDEIVLPQRADGTYDKKPGQAFGPKEAQWTYAAPNRSEFFSQVISGAHRLENGNTFICSGANAIVFEVTPDGDTVWKYSAPMRGGFPGMGGFGPGGFGPPPIGTVLPDFLQGMLQLTGEQRQELGKFHQNAVAKMDQLLTDQQKQTIRDPQGFDFRMIPRPGELLSVAMQERLQLSPEQKQQFDALQKSADETLASILNDEQEQRLKEMKNGNFVGFGPPGGPGGFGPRGPGGPGGFGPRGPGGPPDGPGGRGPGGGPGGFGGRPFGGPGGGPGIPGGGPGGLFRSYRYPVTFAAFTGKTLTPGKPLEELEREPPPPGRPDGPPPPEGRPQPPVRPGTN